MRSAPRPRAPSHWLRPPHQGRDRRAYRFSGIVFQTQGQGPHRHSNTASKGSQPAFRLKMYLDKTRWASTEIPSPLCSVKPSLTRVRVDLLTQPYPTNPRRLSVRPVVPSARSRPDGNVLRDAAKTRRCASRHRMGARRPLPPAQSARKPTVAVREAARKRVARGGPAAARGRRASARARSRLRRPTLRLCPHLLQCLWTRLPARYSCKTRYFCPSCHHASLRRVGRRQRPRARPAPPVRVHRPAALAPWPLRLTDRYVAQSRLTGIGRSEKSA